MTRRIRRSAVLLALAAMNVESARSEVSLTERSMHERKVAHDAATPGALALKDASGLEFYIDADVTFDTGSSASGAASDATYTQAVAATTSAGGTMPMVLEDAFDGHGGLLVDVGGAGNVSYNGNGAATTTCPGPVSGVDRTVVLDPQVIGAVSVQRKVFVPDNDSFLRWLDAYTNTGGIPQTVTATSSSNLGSDATTVVVTSSDGDAVAEPTDTWVTTFQDYDVSGESPDPRLGHVFQGPGAAVGLSSITMVPGSDRPSWQYTFTIQPGETASLMTFVTGQPSKAAAATQAARLVGLPAEALQCMSPTDMAAVVNFAIPADLSIIKTDSPDPVSPAALLTYTLSVSNAGPSQAKSITVTDTLPATALYQSAGGTGWSCSQAAGVVTCTRPDLLPGAAPDITIIVTAPITPGTITNTATVAAVAPDPVLANNTASQPTTVQCGAISLAPATLPSGTLGRPYAQTITASGGTAPYTFAATAGALPPGLTLAANGVLSGTATAVGTFGFTVTATDAGGCTGSQAYSIKIVPLCRPIILSPAALPGGAIGAPYSQTLTASGGVGPYSFAVSSGTLPPGLSLSAAGFLSGTPTTTGIYPFTVTATDAQGCAGGQSYSVRIDLLVDHIVGEGLGDPNLNRVRVFLGGGGPTSVDFLAYGAGHWGTNVASGDVNGPPYGEILTGPGPGAVFGPQVRGFDRAGVPMGKINYYAYGTLKYGVNVSAGTIDADAFDEILTGAGPGAVFGPHVRAWDFDGVSVSAIAKVNFFAYGTLRYGVEVGTGDVEGDGFDEILTGPGPGPAFGPQVRAFDYDGSILSSIAGINFNAYPAPGYGVNLAGGDADGDAMAEIATAPGPGSTSSYPSEFRGFDYDGGPLSALPGYLVTPFTTFYGGRVGQGDVATAGREALLAGAGRDPAADSTVKAFDYTGSALVPLSGTFLPFGTDRYGVNVGAGALGY